MTLEHSSRNRVPLRARAGQRMGRGYGGGNPLLFSVGPPQLPENPPSLLF
jgi:hypothetical protein